MRRKLINTLKCPNCGNNQLRMFAIEAMRGKEIIYNVDDKNLLDSDDIFSGVCVCHSSNSAFVIEKSIGIFLADNDIDHKYLENKLKSIEFKIPLEFEKILSLHLKRINTLMEEGDCNWNFEEMEYYDKSVDDENSRASMLKDIYNNPIWQIFIPRKKYLVQFISTHCQNHSVLEIGSGNSRTVANIFNPNEHSFQYVGSDISFKRLLVAKSAIPEGDFIQANAMNLPFQDNIFGAILSFGMLHHLPRPDICIENCIGKIKKNGFICFHEPILKPKLIKNKKSFLYKMFAAYERSQHDNDLDLSSALKILRGNKFIMVKQNKINSIFKTLLEFILSKLTPRSFYMNKVVVNAVLIIDRFFIHTICRLWNGLGPHGVIIVAKKSEY